MDWFSRLVDWANANEGLLQGLAMLGGVSALLISLLWRRAAERARVGAQEAVRAKVIVRAEGEDTGPGLVALLERYGGRAESDPSAITAEFDDADDAARAALGVLANLSPDAARRTGVLVCEAASTQKPRAEDLGVVVATARVRRALVDADDLVLRPRSSGPFPVEVVAAPEGVHAVARARWALPVAGAALLAVGGALWLRTQWQGPEEPIRSIAVLPFENLSAEEGQGYLADGVTISLIGELSKHRSLRVISRTSVMPFKTTPQSLEEIASRLGIDAVIEGSVQRAGDQIRIDSHLIRIRDERTLWARSYERAFVDVLALQREIASSVSEAVASNVSGEPTRDSPAGTRVADERTMRRFLRANVWLDDRTQESVDRAIREYQHIVSAHSGFVPAYAKLSEAYSVSVTFGRDRREVYVQARALAERALAIDPDLAEAHLALGLLGQLDNSCSFDWDASLEHVRRALDLNPSSPVAHQTYSAFLLAVADFEGAMEHAVRAAALDPLSRSAMVIRGIRLYQLRRFEDAERSFQAVLDEQPDYAQAQRWLGRTWMEQDRVPDGIRMVKWAIKSSERVTDRVQIAYGLALQGRGETARAMLLELGERDISEQPSPLYFARVWAVLGEEGRVFEALEKARQHCQLSGVLYDPAFDRLRDAPPFVNTLRVFGIDAEAQEKWQALIGR